MENFKEFLTKRKLQLEVVKPNATPEEITKAWVALGYKPEDLEAKIRFKMMPDANEPHLNSMNSPIAPSVSSGSVRTNSLEDFKRKAATRSTNAHIATDLKPDELASQLHQAANARNVAQVADKVRGRLLSTQEVSELERSGEPIAPRLSVAMLGNGPIMYKYYKDKDGQVRESNYAKK